MPEQESIDQMQLQAASELPLDKRFYFNGFTIAISPIDCAIVLQYNNQPIALLSTSHTIVKTLVAQLNGLISDFEQKTGQGILKLDEIQDLLSKGQP